MNPIHSALAKLLDVESVQPNDDLRSFENWDSLTVLSLCAALDAQYGVSLSAQDLKDVQTVIDLESLIAARRAA